MLRFGVRGALHKANEDVVNERFGLPIPAHTGIDANNCIDASAGELGAGFLDYFDHRIVAIKTAIKLGLALHVDRGKVHRGSRCGACGLPNLIGACIPRVRIKGSIGADSLGGMLTLRDCADEATALLRLERGSQSEIFNPMVTYHHGGLFLKTHVLFDCIADSGF